MIETYRTILRFLTPSERRRFWLVMIATTFSGLFEAVSVAAILPLLAVLADPSVIESRRILSMVYEWTGGGSLVRFQLILASGVFVLVVSGLMLKILTIYAINRFALLRGYTLSSRLLQGYLHQPYAFFLDRHSSDLGKVVLAEVNQFVTQGMLPAMRLVASCTLAFFLLCLIFLAQPMVAITAALVLGSAYGGIYLAINKLLKRIGAYRLEANRQRFRLSHEAMGGIKDVKLFGLEENYVQRFNDPARQNAHYSSIAMVLRETPRSILEMIAFGGILVFILVMLATSAGDLSDSIPVLGLVAFSSLRLLPALQNIFSLVATIRNNEAVRDELVVDFDYVQKNRSDWAVGGNRERLPLNEELALEDIRFSYPGSDRTSLDGLSMRIPARSTIGLVGGTGAGKTTLVDLVLGLLVPDSGEIRVDGKLVDRTSRHAWQRSVGYVPQQIYLTSDTVAGNIAFGIAPDKIDMAAVERAARAAALHDFVMQELPDGYESEVGERGVRLSGGQRQRIGIARALYRDPDVLVLDEATSALDNLTEQAVMEAVDHLGGTKTVILIAHRLSTVKACDKIFLLERGRVAASGRFDELVRESETFAAMARIA